MRTNVWWWLAALAVLFFPVTSLHAQEGMEPEEPDMEDEGYEEEDEMDFMAEMKAMISGMVSFAGDERFSEEDAKAMIAHFPSFDSAFETEDGDLIEDRLDEQFEKTGKYDLSFVLKMPEFKKWAAGNGLDGEKWLRNTLRGVVLTMRKQMAEGLEEQKKQFEEMKKNASEEGNEWMKEMIPQMEKSLVQMEEMLATMPKPTEEEQKVLEKHGDAIQQAMEGGDDDEDDWDDEDEMEDEMEDDDR